MDVSLSELRELVMDREAWRAAIHGVAKSRTQLSDWTELIPKTLFTRGRGWGEGRMAEGGQRVKTPVHKINKYKGCNVQHDHDNYL